MDASAPLNAGRVMLVLTMFFTYPMESFVARHALVCVVYGEEAAKEDNKRRRYGVTIGLYFAALILSLFLPDLGIVLELTGAVSGSFLSYILPSSMYMCVHEKEVSLSEERRTAGWSEATAKATHCDERRESRKGLGLRMTITAMITEEARHLRKYELSRLLFPFSATYIDN